MPAPPAAEPPTAARKEPTGRSGAGRGVGAPPDSCPDGSVAGEEDGPAMDVGREPGVSTDAAGVAGERSKMLGPEPVVAGGA